MTPLAFTDPLFRQPVDVTIVLIVIGKTLAVFGLLLVSVLMYIWFLRKVIARMQNRVGPATVPGPYGRAAERWPTASSSSSRSSPIPDHRRPARSSSSRRTSRSSPRSSRSAIIPIGGLSVTIAGHQGRTCSSPSSADRRPLPPDAMSGVGLYGVMLAGWASRLEVPAARLGAGERAAALLRGRVRSRRRWRAAALAARSRRVGIVTSAGLDELALRSIVTGEWYWLPAIAIVLVRDLRDRGRRGDEPSAVRPRGGGAGARRWVPSPSTPASGSRSSSSPSS